MGRMLELIRLFRERLIQRVDLYPLQLDAGGYTVVRESLTDDAIRQHITGQLTLGLYTAPDSTTKWLCIDVDTLERTALEELWRRLSGLRLPYLTEFSGQKGYHVWVFFRTPVQNRVARELGRLVTRDHEIFPKQEVIADGGLGNLVKAPLGIHRVTGKRCLFVNRDLKVLPDQLKVLGAIRTFDPGQVLKRHAPNMLNQAARAHAIQSAHATELSAEDARYSSLPIIKDCVRVALLEGSGQGQRNQIGYIIATELRRIGMSPRSAHSILSTLWGRERSMHSSSRPMMGLSIPLGAGRAESSGRLSTVWVIRTACTLRSSVTKLTPLIRASQRQNQSPR